MKRREILAVAATAIWSAPLSAQQKAMPVIGYLGSGSPGYFAPYTASFLRGLDEAGYIEGQNVTIEYRWAEGHYDQLPALAADLVSRKVDVIAANGFAAVRAAKDATSTIPIVFSGGGDPVAEGLVASLGRPGGNVTGVTLLSVELNSKRFELLRELVPQARTVALLVNPLERSSGRVMRELEEAARPAGVQLLILKASSDSEINEAFASLVQGGAGALVVATDPFITSRREQLVALAAHHAVPAIYAFRTFADSGGLISYGPSLIGAYHEVGIDAGKVLKGAKPADMPVVQPTTFEMVLNTKTAKALGLAVPPSILARADELIE